MKRKTSLVTVSLPPQMLKESEKVALDKNMTRSELLRTALRRYLEDIAPAKNSKLNIKKLEKEDTRIWKEIEKDYRRIRSNLVKERYPYLFE